MSNTNTQLFNHLNNGSIWSDPLDPDFTVRFKTTTSQKSLHGQPVANYVTEIIINDLSPITINGDTSNEALSVRLKVSGSTFSQTRLQAIVGTMAGQLSTWMTENVLLGFEPTTAPINPDQS